MPLLLVILDGMPDRSLNGKTPLSVAKKPNMDALADLGVNGIMDVVAPGVRPGSDTSHLALLGYDPYKYYTGRGPIEAAGVGIEVKPGDVAFRANFATVEGEGSIFEKVVVDRRAGRIQDTKELIKAIREEVELPVDFYIERGSGHRAAVVFRGEGLQAEVSDVDPKVVGAKVKKANALNEEAQKTAEIVNEFVQKVHEVLDKHPINEERQKAGLPKANALLLRGAGIAPRIPSFKDKYNLKLCVIAAAAIVKGVGAIVGGKTVTPDGATGNKFTDVNAKVKCALRELKHSDVVLLHFKATDELGHDGDFDGKREFIEKVDSAFEDLLNLDACIILTSDHSTPVKTREHTADPVPIAMVHENVRRDEVTKFSEFEAFKGGLCRIRGLDVMNIALDLLDLAKKFGA
ncbi:MAG: 2,3-bisphosphoglycerate-independent phosphoglycerate mutase [Archaeoglobaceae archaeon]